MGVPLNIDWQQILLHLFNFSILAGGLYLLLYKPVKSFMQKREEYYKNMDCAANKKLDDAKQAEAEYLNKISEIEKESAALKSKAVKEAEIAAKERLADAEKEKQHIIANAKEAAEAEKSKILHEANEEIEGMVSAAIDKMLASLGKNPFDDFLDSAKKE